MRSIKIMLIAIFILLLAIWPAAIQNGSGGNPLVLSFVGLPVSIFVFWFGLSRKN